MKWGGICIGLGVLLCATCPSADAQARLFKELRRMLPGDSQDTTSVALGDLNGDGRLDAFVANWGRHRLLLNSGWGKLVDASNRLPAGVHLSTSLALGDVDGDGDLDAVIGNDREPGKQNRLYLNDEGGTFIDATALLPHDSDATLSLAAGDLDGDGDVDVFLGEARQNRIYMNVRRQLAWRASPRFSKPLTLDVSGPAGEPWWMFASTGRAAVPVPPFGVIDLDLTHLVLLGQGVLDTSGEASRSFLIPPNPGGITGVTLFGQGVVGLAPRVTNLERVTITDL